jgi:ribose transport system permease protein
MTPTTPLIEQTPTSGEGRGAARARPQWDAVRKGVQRNRSVLIGYLVLVLLIAAYASKQSGVLSLTQLNIQTAGALTLILIALGQTIVMLTGNIDLSVGGTVSLTTVVASSTFGMTGGPVLWVVLLLAMGVFIGVCNGVLVTYLKLPSFIATLATWSILDGLALAVRATPGGTIPLSYVTNLTKTVGQVGVPTLIFAGIIVVCIWFRATRTMSRLRSVGSSAASSRLAGVSVSKVVILGFALSGLLSAAGGLFLITELGAGDPTVGGSYVLDSVAAAVIGGTALVGGRGDILGAISGGLVITLLGSLVFAFGLASYWQTIAAGGLLVIAAAVGAAFTARSEKEG